MRIIYVEDDIDQAISFQEGIRQAIHGVEFVVHNSEWSFLRSISDSMYKPDLFVFDRMIRWSSLDDLMDAGESPEGWLGDEAGIRLLNITRVLFPRKPIILYSVVDEEEMRLFKPPTFFVQKDGNFQKLILTIRSIRSLTHESPVKATPTAKKLMEALQLRPGVAGFGIDLKQVYEAILKPQKRKT